MTETTPHKNTLIGMVLRKQDLLTAQRESWYRLPVKSAPEIVQSSALTTLALYQTKAFDEEKYSVRWWGTVSSIDRRKRGELLPNEPAHPRANEEYFVVRVHSFEPLPKPVLSRIPRRNPFITTTDERLFAARDYNDLFYGSPLEEKLWSALQKEGIPAQRELMVSKTVARKKQHFYLDFALFCKDVNVAIECDGNTYHNAPKDVRYDKDRDVTIQNMRWVVYRFTTDKITNHLDETVQHIKQAVRQYGGIVDVLNPSKIEYFPTDDGLVQMTMFG
jgi:very-short-patch-repair endonuclease